MTSRTTMVPYTAPGLPTWPRLWFDSNQKRAKVTVRAATWRSWLYAYYGSRTLRWLLNFVVGWKLWYELDLIENPFGRGFWILIAVGMFSAIAKPFMHATLDGFLARQLFAVKTVFWFNPRAVAVRSRLYANGVVIWRTWEQGQITILFDVEPDSKANETQAREDRGLQQFMYRQKSACLLRLIIETSNQNCVPMATQHPNSMRSIPVIEFDMEDAVKTTVVLLTAVALTQQSVKEHPLNQPPGIDIDVASP